MFDFYFSSVPTVKHRGNIHNGVGPKKIADPVQINKLKILRDNYV